MLNGKQLKIIGSSFVVLSCGLTSAAVFADTKPSGAPLKPTVQQVAVNSSLNSSPTTTVTPAPTDNNNGNVPPTATSTPAPTMAPIYNPPPVSSYGS